MVNYYQVLGLPFGAPLEQVRKAYRECAKHFHPDKHQNSEFFKTKFQDLQQAYEVLCDEALRREYEQDFLGNKYDSNSSALRNELIEERQKVFQLEAEVSSLQAKLKDKQAECEILLKYKQAHSKKLDVSSNSSSSWRNAFILLVLVGIGLVLYSAVWQVNAAHNGTAEDIPVVSTPQTSESSVIASKSFPEGFEENVKEQDGQAEKVLATGIWSFQDAFISNSNSDHKEGQQAVRILNQGRLTMQFDAIAGVKRISILAAAFGQDGPSTWELWLSRDRGRTWYRNGLSQTANGPTLRPSLFIGLANEPIRLEIRKTDGSNNRLNIDNITIETAAGPAIAADDSL